MEETPVAVIVEPAIVATPHEGLTAVLQTETKRAVPTVAKHGYSQGDLKDAAEAVEKFGDDELERYAASRKPINNTPIGAHTSMSIIEFSSSIADAEAPVPIPAGEYPAEIRSAEPATSEKGNRYAKISLYISPDSYPADFTDGDPDGTQLTYNRLSLNDDARSRYRLRKFLETVGLTPGQSVDLNDWMGLAVTVRIKHGEWEGEKRAEVERIVSGA